MGSYGEKSQRLETFNLDRRSMLGLKRALLESCPFHGSSGGMGVGLRARPERTG